MPATSSHSSALYTVRVRAKGRGKSQDFREFGDLHRDGTRSSLMAAIEGYAQELNASSDDGLKDVSGASADVVNGDLRLSLTHGQRGVAGRLIDPQSNLKAVVQSGDTEEVVCGALFRLPASQTLGWMCLHVNNGRGIKRLLTDAIITRFREDFPKLMLVFEPCQLEGVLRAAVDQGRVEKVKLVKYVQPSDRAEYAVADRWVSRGQGTQIEVNISSRGNWLQSRLIQNLWNGDHAAWNSIIEFQEMSFDQAKVEVKLENGIRRTFNIETPDAGHPITQELSGLEYDENGAPTLESLFGALSAAVDDVAD